MRAWLAQRQDDRRAWRWLWVSVALHLPLTPLGPLFGLVPLLTRCSEPAGPIEELRGIPVELLEDAPPEPQAQADLTASIPAEVAPEPAIVAPKKHKRRKPGDVILDAGATPDDAGQNESPVAALDASVALSQVDDAGVDAGAAVAQAPSAEEALSATTHGIADSNANVRLNIYMSRVRQHPLGANLGQLLRSLNQWRDFFYAGGLDPVRDFDQIMLFGPQFSDSSQIAAFLQHNVRAPRMKGAIDALMKRSGTESEWVKGTKYPVAHAHADRAERSFIMYPSQVVAVLPPKVEKDALALSNFKLPTPKGGELVSAFVKQPANPLRNLGFQLSKSIRSASIKVFAESDGGARIEAVLDDASAEAAEKDAKQIRRDVDSITLASNWFLSRSRFAEPVQATVSANKITLELVVTRSQAGLIFDMASSALTPEGRRTIKDALRTRMIDAGVPKSPSPIQSGSVDLVIPDKANPPTEPPPSSSVP